MKMSRMLILLFALAAFGTSVASSEPTGPRWQFGTFYSSLSAYGEWIQVDGLTVWRPMNVRPGWRPYMEGRWVWTDYGWYWVSYEPFGWATFHYGRWYYDDFYGWIWIPDDVWGPAWVEWRYNDNYVGWAPLPPYATFSMSFGIRFTTHWVTPHYYWNFVPCSRFGTVVRYRDFVDENHTRRLIGTTRSGGQYEIDRDRIVNRGIDRTFLEHRGSGRFDRVEIRETGDRRRETIERDPSIGTERIETYRPSREELTRSDEPIRIQRGERNLSLDVDRVERPREVSQPDRGSRPEGGVRTEDLQNQNRERPSGENAQPPRIQSPQRTPQQPQQERPRSMTPQYGRENPSDRPPRMETPSDQQPRREFRVPNVERRMQREGSRNERPSFERPRPAPPTYRSAPTPSGRGGSREQPKREERGRGRE